MRSFAIDEPHSPGCALYATQPSSYKLPTSPPSPAALSSPSPSWSIMEGCLWGRGSHAVANYIIHSWKPTTIWEKGTFRGCFVISQFQISNYKHWEAMETKKLRWWFDYDEVSVPGYNWVPQRPDFKSALGVIKMVLNAQFHLYIIRRTRIWISWAKLLAPGQLVGYPWKLWGITVQTSYVKLTSQRVLLFCWQADEEKCVFLETRVNFACP